MRKPRRNQMLKANAEEAMEFFLSAGEGSSAFFD
jgi:hypothetical protein